MGYFVFTDKKEVRNLFSDAAVRSDVAFFQVDQLKKELRRIVGHALVYLDVSSCDQRVLDRALKCAAERSNYRCGVVDPEGCICDPAALFHQGAVDYLGPDLFGTRVSLERLEAAAAYAGLHIKKKPSTRSKAESGAKLSGTNWESVRQGQEYTFFMLYAVLDRYQEIKDRQAAGQVSKLVSLYREYLENAFAPAGGMLWIWNEPAGLFLFPFDGRTHDPVIACMRLMLNKKIFNVEKIGSTICYSYRFALHLGDTMFRRRGDTEQIVSEAVNYIFHIGQRFIEDGNLYITEEVTGVLPSNLRKVFLPAGSFEGKNVLRFNLPRNL